MPMTQDMLQMVAAALDASDDVLAAFDVDPQVAGGLRFADVSVAFQRFCGHGRAALAGRPLGMLVAPEAAGSLQRIEAAVHGLVPLRGDLLVIEKDGRRVWLGYHLMPVPAVPRAPDNSVFEKPRFVLVGRDITQRRAEADQTRLVQGLVAKSFMSAQAPLAIVAPDGHFLMTNHCFESLAGHGEGALAGKPSFAVFGAAFRPALQAARDAQMVDGAPYELEVELLTADGRLLPVRLASRLVERSDRQRCRVLTLHRIGTEERFVAGRVAFITLEDIRATMGSRWESVADRVLATAEGMIRRRLEFGDLLSCNGKRGFTIRFAHADEEQAALRAAAIALDIRHHLIGRGEDAAATELQVVVAAGGLRPNEPSEAQMLRRLDHVEAAALQAERVGPKPIRIRPILAAGSLAPLGVHVRPPGRSATGGAIAFPRSTFDQDLEALQQVIELPLDRAAAMIFLDVGFDTFLSRSKTERYVAACAHVPQPTRQNLVFLLSVLPNGVTASLLQDIVRRLKSHGGGVGCHLGELAPPPVDLRLVPLSIVALEPALWRQAGAGAQERLRRLTSFLQVHHTRLIAMDVPSGASHALSEAGATYLTPAAEEGSPVPAIRSERRGSDVGAVAMAT